MRALTHSVTVRLDGSTRAPSACLAINLAHSTSASFLVPHASRYHWRLRLPFSTTLMTAYHWPLLPRWRTCPLTWIRPLASTAEGKASIVARGPLQCGRAAEARRRMAPCPFFEGPPAPQRSPSYATPGAGLALRVRARLPQTTYLGTRITAVGPGGIITHASRRL